MSDLEKLAAGALGSIKVGELSPLVASSGTGVSMITDELAWESYGSVLDIINDIEKARGKAKIEILRHHRTWAPLRNVLKACYDPTATYGVTEIPTTPETGKIANWWDVTELLRKLASRDVTGNAAQLALGNLYADLPAKEKELLRRVIARDMRCGINVSSINTAMGGLIPEFSPMLAHKFEPKRIKKWPQIVQPKLDGVRVIAIVNLTDQRADFLSRTGKPFPACAHLAQPLIASLDAARAMLMARACDEYDEAGLPDGEDTDCGAMDELYAKHGVDDLLHVVLDGEIVSGSFNKTVSEVRRSDEAALDAEFHIFDILSAEEFFAGKSEKTYEERLKYLADVHSAFTSEFFKVLPTYTVNSVGEIQSICANVMAKGLEGLIVKNPDGHYEGKRSYNWLKIKAEETEDLKVVGVYNGEPGTKYEKVLGGLLVDRNGVTVRVGGGFSDKQRFEFWDAYERDLVNKVDPSKGIVGELLGRLIEVEFHEVTPDGSLRHPRFKRFRDDKA